MNRTRILAGAVALASGFASSSLPAHAAATDYRFELVGKPQLSGQKDIVQYGWSIPRTASRRPTP